MNEVWNNIKLEPFNDFCQRMFQTLDEKKAKRLIIDLRLNTGGNHIELPLLKGILARPNIDQPDRLFLIIGRVTVSAAQHLTSEMEWYTNATLFGEGTSSKPNQYGAMRRFNLPHSGLEISIAVDYYQDAQPFDFRMSSYPDFIIQPSSIDFKNNYDPVLKAIFDFDTYKNLRDEFFTNMSEAYSQGGLDSLKKEYFSVKDQYINKGYNLENLLYEDIDPWLVRFETDKKLYIEFLRFALDEFPNSININFDLGYWEQSEGNYDIAIKYFKKCLELNPEHHYAKWRLGLIELEKK